MYSYGEFMRVKDRRRDYIKDIAVQRIEKLIKLAEEVYSRDQELANRYAELAYRISLRARVKIPKKYKYRICRKCRAFLVPGRNMSVRLKSRREPHLVIKCLVCGYTKRIPYKKGLKVSKSCNNSSGSS